MAKIALTHASGLLAEALIASMVESGVSPDSVVLLDAEDKAGQRLGFGDTYITLLDQHAYDYEDLAAVLLLHKDAELEQLLQHAGCPVLSHVAAEPVSCIDCSREPDAQSITSATGTVGLPDAAQSTLLPIIHRIHEWSPLRALHVVNILSASVFGQAAVDELATQTINLLNSRDIESAQFPLRLAFNMLPQEAGDQQATRLQDFLALPDTRVAQHDIVVAAFHGLAISVQLEFQRETDPQELRNQLANLPETRIMEDPASPVTDCQKGSETLIYGLLQTQKDAKSLQFWIIADSVRNRLVKNYQSAIEILLNSFL